MIIKEGEISVKGARVFRAKGIFSFVINTIFGRISRNLLSVIAIGLPGGLLMLFVFVSYQLEGALHATLLGDYVTIRITTPIYFLIAISFIIAAFTTFEITKQNLKERSSEISLFKSVGWSNSYIRTSVILEGAIIGILGAIVGMALYTILLLIMYGDISINALLISISVSIVPIFIGMVGTTIPSFQATNVSPSEGLKKNIA